MPTLLVAVAGFRHETRGGTFDAGRIHHPTPHGQVVEQRGHAFEEQRQVVLDPARGAAIADALVEQAARGVAFEANAVAAAEVLDGIRVQRKFARGQQLYAGELVRGALRFRVKGADAFHFVVEEVDAVRRRRAHGEQVDERAAHGEFAMGNHLRHRGVARRREARTERFHIQPLAGVQLQRVRFHERARRHALQQRFQWRYHQRLFQRGQACQRTQALRGQVRVRREQVVRQRFVVGEEHHRQLRVREERQFAMQLVRLAAGGCDHEQRRFRAHGGFGQGQGPGGAVQLAPGNVGALARGRGQFESGAGHGNSGGNANDTAPLRSGVGVQRY